MTSGAECRPDAAYATREVDLALQNGGSLAGRWTWEELQSLPQTEITVDIHCVTKWSKLGT
jgi:hypothetical protein